MIYLVAPAGWLAGRLDDALSGDDNSAYFMLFTSNEAGAVEYARERAKERHIDMCIYKLTETHYLKAS